MVVKTMAAVQQYYWKPYCVGEELSLAVSWSATAHTLYITVLFFSSHIPIQKSNMKNEKQDVVVEHTHTKTV